MKGLEIINADTLLYTTIEEPDYIVEDIIPTGLHLFCGASKVGKSWLMLDLSIKVSKGEPIWNLKTKKCDVLYLCLEDTKQRLQQRLFTLTDEISSNLHLVKFSNTISDGLIIQLQDAIKRYPNIKLIIIDTLQKIRKQSNDINYSNDYGDISILKDFADKNKLAIILVHHLRKQNDNDVFNRISGTTGIMGSSDTIFILEKKSREDSTATLYVTGRDIEYQTFTLRFEKCRWILLERSSQKDLEKKNVPNIIYDVINFMQDKTEWIGSATELLKILQVKDTTPQLLTKQLNEFRLITLRDYNIEFETSRNSQTRLIVLKRIFKEDEQIKLNDDE